MTDRDYLSHNSRTNPFALSIFKDDIGRAYQELIIALTKDPASARISLKEAEEKLQALGEASVKLRTDHLNHLIGTKIRYNESEPMFKLHSELNQLEDSYIEYNHLRQAMKRALEFGIHSMTPVITEALNTKETEAIKGAGSISDLNEKFLTLATELEPSLKAITAYKTLRQDIKALKISEPDQGMTNYLRYCDDVIFASGTPDVGQINVTIAQMQLIKDGLTRTENM